MDQKQEQMLPHLDTHTHDARITRTVARPSPSQEPKEEKGSLRSHRLRPSGDDNFDEFWAAYPRRAGRDDAKSALAKALRRVTMADIMLALYRQVWPDDPRYIPYPATWLNQGRWADDPLAAAPEPVPKRGRLTQAFAQLDDLIANLDFAHDAPDLLQ